LALVIDILGLAASFTTFFGVYAILSLSLNLEYGFAGQPNFGKVLFYSVGCYVAGYISTVFLLYLRGISTSIGIGSSEAIVLRGVAAQSEPLINAASFGVSLIVGFVFAGFVGYVASFPALKLREDYLAITLLAAGEIVRIVIRGVEWFSGGTQGIAGVTNPFIWISDVKIRYLAYALVVLGFALLTYVCISRLTNSPYGRLLKSVRDDDLASSSFGKKIPRVRGMVLVVGSGFAGIAGVLYTYYSGFVQADAFVPVVTFSVWVMVIVGGSANIRGSFVGALIVSVVDTTTRVFGLQIQSSMPGVLFDPSYLRYIAYAALIVLILMYRPSGLLPEKPVRTPAWDVIGEESSA
jgi:branched-chain amino acid transport system permease protein